MEPRTNLVKTKAEVPAKEFASRIPHTDGKNDSANRIVNRSSNNSSAPLPPEGTPLKQTFADLAQRAEAGDVAAASRLAKDTRTCVRTSQMETDVARIARQDPKEGLDKIPSELLKFASAELNAEQFKLDYVKRNAPLCNGLSQDQYNSMFPNTLRAAQLGSLADANCFVGTSLASMPGLLDHPEWLVNYKDNALSIAQMAVERGSWTMAETLAQSYAGNLSTVLIGKLTGEDAAMAYRYLSLWRLGLPPSSNDMKNILDRELADAARSLTPDQLGAASDWAQNAYLNYFNDNPAGATDQVNMCPN
ncbi:MAG: hypothetical protein ABI375_09780 [Rudaea sp.]